MGVDESESSQRALAHAVELAEAGNARLTLITVAPAVSSLVSLTGLSIELLSAEVDRWAGKVLKATLEVLPPDVIARTIAAHGDPGPEIVAELSWKRQRLRALPRQGSAPLSAVRT